MFKRSLTAPALVLSLAAASPAADKYDLGGNGDDSSVSRNTLSHGVTQEHDLDEGAGFVEDFDWMAVPAIARHSYEARVSGSSVFFDSGGCSSCAQFERVDGSGGVLTDDVSVVNQHERSVRWIATLATVNEFVRVRGDLSYSEDADDHYTIRYWDTTYSIPRWNASSGQVTVFLIQNMTQVAVSGQIDFHNAGGTLLHTQAFTTPASGSFAFNTGTVPALGGQAGHAYVAHTGGYGSLAGKAVALDPATGFSFDTPMTPIPH